MEFEDLHYNLHFQIISGRPYGVSVDWWALGVLMYEMMCGRVSGDGCEWGRM